MKSLRSLALLPLAWCVACGGDSDFSSGGDDDALAFDELPASFAAAQCDLFERCAGPLYHVFFTLEDCETSAEAQYRDGGFGALEAAVEAKTVTYDGKKAAACLDILSKRECTEVNQRTIDECEDALVGTVSLGDACEIDEECMGSIDLQSGRAVPGDVRRALSRGGAVQRKRRVRRRPRVLRSDEPLRGTRRERRSVRRRRRAPMRRRVSLCRRNDRERPERARVVPSIRSRSAAPARRALPPSAICARKASRASCSR